MNSQRPVRPLPIRISNHNQTVITPVFGDGLATNHNQTVVPLPTVNPQHNQTIVRG